MFQQKLFKQIQTMHCKFSDSINNNKSRYIPTFHHEPIFDECEKSQHHTRYNATYHSTIFDGYLTVNHNCHPECKKVKKQPKASNGQQLPEENIAGKAKNQRNMENHTVENVQSLQKNGRKIGGLTAQEGTNPWNKGIYNHTYLWYDPSKQMQLQQFNKSFNRGHPKERKLLQLSSSPFEHPQQNIPHQTQYTFCQEKEIPQIGQSKPQVEVAQDKPLVPQEKGTEKEEKKEEEEPKEEVKKEVKEEVKKEVKEEVKGETKKETKEDQPKQQKKCMKKYVPAQSKTQTRRPNTAGKVKTDFESRHQPVFRLVRKPR